MSAPADARPTAFIAAPRGHRSAPTKKGCPFEQPFHHLTSVGTEDQDVGSVHAQICGGDSPGPGNQPKAIMRHWITSFHLLKRQGQYGVRSRASQGTNCRSATLPHGVPLFGARAGPFQISTTIIDRTTS